MKKVYIRKPKSCDICGKEAKYDSPSRSGPWGNFCKDCFKIHCKPNNIGYELVVVKDKNKGEVVNVSETLHSDYIELICPLCKSKNKVEIDCYNKEIQCVCEATLVRS